MILVVILSSSLSWRRVANETGFGHQILAKNDVMHYLDRFPKQSSVYGIQVSFVYRNKSNDLPLFKMEKGVTRNFCFDEVLWQTEENKCGSTLV